ncbi:Cyclase-like protein 2 [Sesamum angolense]|uniref:Cyclase-like protein 2 n=1 Tax=Sesamum angolense TaxID=2727404 RepID=A0AAE1WYB8_9LAMI|nr:Cyclase-like protein 2 [Sesamum angolense]
MSTFHVLLVWALVQAIPFLAVSILLSDCAYPSGYGDGSGNCVGVADVSLKPQRREADENENIFDITHKFTPHTPVGDSTEGIGQFLTLLTSMKNGSDYNFSEMKLPVHSGTHVDAPGHMYDNYFDEGYDVDTLDLRVLNGPALLIDVPRDKNITAEVMKSLNIPKGVRRVLFRTLNTDRRLMYKKEFDTSYVGFMKDGAQWLVDNTDIKLVGIDYLSVAAFADLIPSHLVLLRGRDIILVEGLKLDDVQPGIYSVHCLPLRLVGAEGSPIRCILIKELKAISRKSLRLDGRVSAEGWVQDIIFIEGLKLDDIPTGLYSVPLRLVGEGGSPIRCILIK